MLLYPGGWGAGLVHCGSAECRSSRRPCSQCAASLSIEMFSSDVMLDVKIDMMAMKVFELKAELEARGKGRTGNKAWVTNLACSDRARTSGG